MNPEMLRAKCEQAKAELIRRGSYCEDDFMPADGEESIYAPMGMERRYTRNSDLPNHNGFLEPGPLKGTPLLWRRTSFECDEWDCSLPCDVLDDEDAIAATTDEEWAAMAAE